MNWKDLPLNQLNIKFERRLKRFSELEILGLKKHQVYPPNFLELVDYILPEKKNLIDKTTQIGSMGSCFAREIKKFLENNRYNYVSRGGGQFGSAPWERVYNTACVGQEIKRAFGKFSAELIQASNGRIIDPFRKKTFFQNIDDAHRQCEIYIAAAKSALLDSEVFVLTLGLSEVWYDKESGYVFAEAPPADIYDRRKHAFKLLEPEENYQYLKEAIELVKLQNPKIEIILTVSPVPLRATFFNRSAIVSNTVSKASLIFAAHKISQQFSFVHYFPSYEITFHLSDDPFEWDYRHVKTETIEIIMNCFENTYCLKI